MLGQCKTKDFRLYPMQLGLTKLLIVGGVVLLRYGREQRAQSFYSMSMLCHWDGIKTSVVRQIGRFV